MHDISYFREHPKPGGCVIINHVGMFQLLFLFI